jgi:hypothetical protein
VYFIKVQYSRENQEFWQMTNDVVWSINFNRQQYILLSNVQIVLNLLMFQKESGTNPTSTVYIADSTYENCSLLTHLYSVVSSLNARIFSQNSEKKKNIL